MLKCTKLIWITAAGIGCVIFATAAWGAILYCIYRVGKYALGNSWGGIAAICFFIIALIALIMYAVQTELDERLFGD